jgi:DNA-binding NarL/FixJ family response regulator
MLSPVKVAILEDHQGIIDGYHMRLDETSGIAVVGIANNGEELDALLHERPDMDVLIMDVNVPTSATNNNLIPILNYVPRILAKRPHLNILVISMLTQVSLMRALAKIGVSGYISKDDSASIRRLPAIIKQVSAGGTFFSVDVGGLNGKTSVNAQELTSRQLEILNVCASYPDLSTDQVALMLGTASSTVRNSLSDTYDRLSVHSKAAAIAKARDLGLIP